jgi:uncharacterized protein YkwD
MMTKKSAPLAVGLMIAATLTLAACSSVGGGGGSGPAALSAGLSARMDQPGASLNKQEAIGLINAYRATRGVAPLTHDTGLDGTAQALVNQYAQTGSAPATPQGLAQMKLSAGYATFAETFSGWRNSAADAAALAAPASKAGVAVAFNPSSSYGIYWVLVLGN